MLTYQNCVHNRYSNSLLVTLNARTSIQKSAYTLTSTLWSSHGALASGQGTKNTGGGSTTALGGVGSASRVAPMAVHITTASNTRGDDDVELMDVNVGHFLSFNAFDFFLPPFPIPHSLFTCLSLPSPSSLSFSLSFFLSFVCLFSLEYEYDDKKGMLIHFASYRLKHLTPWTHNRATRLAVGTSRLQAILSETRATPPRP